MARPAPARPHGWHPADTVAAGGRYAYDFEIANRSGLYWYHTHAHELTAEQAYAGLAGLLVVEDDDERKLRQALDLTLGVTDIPLLLQDKRFDADGRLVYGPMPPERMMGYLGDVMLVNLTPNPLLEIGNRLYRFRLLNGSNARIYRLAFVRNGKSLPFTVVGTDGGLLDAPRGEREAFLAPGERLDVLFDASDLRKNDEVFLKSLAFDAMEGGGMGGMMQAMGPMSASRLPAGHAFNILRLRVTRTAAGARAPIPAKLSTPPTVDTGKAKRRSVKLTMAHMQWLIDGREFRMNEIPLTVRKGATEIWDIQNADRSMPHPMHLHGFLFRVLARRGTPRALRSLVRDGSGRVASDFGWKDTVLVWPGETVSVAVDFTHDFNGDQRYVFHCHNLEHEDAGMMINYAVTA